MLHSPGLREATQAFVQGCFSTPSTNMPELSDNTIPKPTGTLAACRRNFVESTDSFFFPNTHFTNHESLPPMKESFTQFRKAFPQFSETNKVDLIRATEYNHLSLSNHVCLDYLGIGLFSHSQTILDCSSSSSSPPPQCSDFPFFSTLYKSVNLKTQLLHGDHSSELESTIKKRIMDFLNISEDDYCMVFTTNRSSAFKLVAESYPFRSSRKLLTVYDYESEAVEGMINTSEKRGAEAMSAEFKWPRLRIHSEKLRKILVRKKKQKRHRGLFVFPLQSRITGTSYSFQWMRIAQENGWHILLDACALGPKDMNSFGLSLLRPDFLVCSFYKVFGENPTGFGCLFVKKSMIPILEDSTSTDTELEQAFRMGEDEAGVANPSSLLHNTSVQTQVPAELKVKNLSRYEMQSSKFSPKANGKTKEVGKSLLLNVQENKPELGANGSLEIKCRGLDHVDSLGLVQISNRMRCLINWLINALIKLQHPHTENKISLVRIYGPKVKFDRGPALAFNVYDWKGEKVEPVLVQKLADRSNISLSNGFLHQIWFSENYEEEKERLLESRCEGKEKNKNKKTCNGITVVTAALGFLANFEDTYRLWSFIARFLDADFVEKERWRYTALNQKTVEV
ncbi:Molybdenum cofactor sulfurase [Heracleum sosnowskyi]|uniref:Molybdenum cofactor sulfurase n=1 Tax=Heracleum sosnowskyi TaxID=360622 RepID=A0AAD8IXV3_9APIA|nr:Molybdenum cofactor sulfurase [Heracleum sosnowskyi]